MLTTLIAIACAQTAPDLTAKYRTVNGHPTLVVSRQQWHDIRRALFKLDRATLAALVSSKNGITATVHSCTWDVSKNGKQRGIPNAYTEHLTKERFLHIGDKDAYGVSDGSISTAEKGDTIYFKWLWADIAGVEKRVEPTFNGVRKFHDNRKGGDTWEMFGGWSVSNKSTPTSRIVFVAENNRLVIHKIDISVEPD